ncbi:uncharacterized protein DMAD_03586 [Drosophila madeirensis]|uniref:Uncharacterized protein n=1 Tax=Drosophila madeirensis TaxID=30013 RepID=A0AAU9G872_DROMD
MSSTQLLHSLSLLLLPLRCRRNCNQLISLAILLLSALSARIEESGQQEQQSEEAEQEAAAAEAEKEEKEKDKEVDEDDNDTPYIATKVALKRRSLIINPIPNPHPQSHHPYPHPNLHQNPHQIPTSGRTFAKGTGTGAALTSWHSSHSHRSPGAKSSEEAEEQHQARLLASRIIVLHLACASLLLHTLGTSSISSPSIARLAERTTTTTATPRAAGAATTKRLAAAALTHRSKILESGVSSNSSSGSSSSSSTNPSTPVAGRAVSRRVTAPAAAAAGVSIAT